MQREALPGYENSIYSEPDEAKAPKNIKSSENRALLDI